MFVPVTAVLALLAGCQAADDAPSVPTPLSSTSPLIVAQETSLELRGVVTSDPWIPSASTHTPLSRATRQSNDSAEQTAAAQALDCAPGTADPLAGRDSRALPLVTCAPTESMVYILEPEFLPGNNVASVSASYDPQRAQWVVNLRFTSAGTTIWADFTSKNVNRQVAFVLDSQVISAPNIQSAILDGITQITGKFTEQSAQQLAHQIAGS